MTENLVNLGLQVTLVEMLPHVMPPFDPEMAEPVARHLESKKVRVELEDAVAGFERKEDGSVVVKTQAGRFEALARRVEELHSYDVPEVIALPLAAGTARYLAWLDEAVTG